MAPLERLKVSTSYASALPAPAVLLCSRVAWRVPCHHLVVASLLHTAGWLAWLLQILMQVQGNNKVYVGIMQGLRHMWLTDGVRGLFKGNGLNCIRIFPNSAIKFLTYEQLSR